MAIRTSLLQACRHLHTASATPSPPPSPPPSPSTPHVLVDTSLFAFTAFSSTASSTSKSNHQHTQTHQMTSRWTMMNRYQSKLRAPASVTDNDNDDNDTDGENSQLFTRRNTPAMSLLSGVLHPQRHNCKEIHTDNTINSSFKAENTFGEKE